MKTHQHVLMCLQVNLSPTPWHCDSHHIATTNPQATTSVLGVDKGWRRGEERVSGRENKGNMHTGRAQMTSTFFGSQAHFFFFSFLFYLVFEGSVRWTGKKLEPNRTEPRSGLFCSYGCLNFCTESVVVSQSVYLVWTDKSRFKLVVTGIYSYIVFTLIYII
jgi:hypothetical protein